MTSTEELLQAADAIDAAMAQYVNSGFTGHAWHVLNSARARLKAAVTRVKFEEMGS